MIRLVALVTAASWHASCALFRGPFRQSTHGCAGTSPTGIEWAYLQPKHTGTGAVINEIRNATGNAMCVHNHDYRRLPQQTFKSQLQGFGFTFLQTPFKRVLTSCFFHRACNHSDDEETAVQQFRDFVMQTYKFRDTASARGMRLKSISAVMGAPRPGYDMLGRTSHLIEDLTTIFKLLGYNSTVIARLSSTSAYHCISSCAMLGYNYTTSGRQLMIEGLETDDISKFAEKKNTGGLIRTTSGRDQNIRWYDRTTARIIKAYFQADFERFNFSRDPRHTYMDSWRMQAEFAAAEANLKTMALL